MPLEADVDSLHDLLRSDAGHLCLRDTLLRLGVGQEDAQSVELDADTHCEQLGQTGGEHAQDSLDVLQSVLRTVSNHVLGETAGVQRRLTIHLGKILTKSSRGAVGVLLQIDTQNGCIY